jgi:L-gulono-1,4-lactone dehydrogenase
MKTRKKATWTNVAGLHTAKPIVFYQPETYEDIVRAVQEAEQRKCKIRAVGSGHTSTDQAICDGILLDMSLLNAVSPVNKDYLKVDRRGECLVRMDAGANIDTFNDELDEMGIAFKTLGIIDHQTISGAIATGTHGCCPSLPGFPGLVKSILLVAAKGKKYRIEPNNGITDPHRHIEEGVKLIQNDTTFYSALVHVGLFGIVASYIMEVEPQYWLLEKRTVEKWSDVRKQIENNTLHKDYPVKIGKVYSYQPVLGLHIALNPHEVDGDHTCMVGRFFKLPGKPRRSLGDRIRSLLPTIVASTMLPFLILVRLANRKPSKLPKMMEKGLHSMNEGSYINKSYKVWNQGLEKMMDKTYGSEFAFDGTNPQWLLAIDAIFERAKVHAKDNLYSPNTLMLRYSKGSPATLGVDFGPGVVAWIGTPVPKKFHRGKEILDAHQEVCLAYGGKSHWGKMNNLVTPARIATWFPHLDEWKAEMRKFNPDDTFSNAFSERFGLTSDVKVGEKV